MDAGIDVPPNRFVFFLLFEFIAIFNFQISCIQKLLNLKTKKQKDELGIKKLQNEK